MSRADYWICPVCDGKALYDDSVEDPPDSCRPVTVVHDECLELIEARAAEQARAKVAEEIAEAITLNVRNPDFDKQDRGVWSGLTECMAYVQGHDKAATIARSHATADSATTGDDRG